MEEEKIQINTMEIYFQINNKKKNRKEVDMRFVLNSHKCIF